MLGMGETMTEETIPMFDLDNTWKKEWKGMPEYDNEDYPAPEVIVTFKFRTREDFEKFNEIIKKSLFNGEKPFDGRQEVNSKTAWYPPKEKSSKYVYGEENES
jgi:hypothetical protein